MTANELANRARQYYSNECVHEPDPNYNPFSYTYTTDEPTPPLLFCRHKIWCWVESTWYLSGVRPVSFHCSTVHCSRSSKSLYRFRLLYRSFLRSLGCCPVECWRKTRNNCLAPASHWLSVRTPIRYTSAPSDSVRPRKSDWRSRSCFSAKYTREDSSQKYDGLTAIATQPMRWPRLLRPTELWRISSTRTSSWCRLTSRWNGSRSKMVTSQKIMASF